MVDAYRPDLKNDKPPGKPIFHTLNPCHLKEQRERDRREVSVADLLNFSHTKKHQEDATKLPRHLLVLGRPESGKTALFALILHYWLHGKHRIHNLVKFDFLLAVQCLGLESLSSDCETTTVDLEKHMLDHLPKSVEKHGEEVVRQAMRKAKVLLMIDSLDFLDKTTIDKETSLSPWSDSRVLLLCRYKFMKDNNDHAFFCEQSEDNLVLKLWGGLAPNLFQLPENSHEDISELGGVFSENLLTDYCERLCKCERQQENPFHGYCHSKLKYLSMDMRKPFNIYWAMKVFCGNADFDVKTQSELYSKWLEIWSKSYRASFHRSDADAGDLTIKGMSVLTKLAHNAFTTENEYISHKDIQEHGDLMGFLSHFLLPHYNPHGKIQHFTFRIAAHKFFLAAKKIFTEIEYGTRDMEDMVRCEELKKNQQMLPIILGVAKGIGSCDKLKEHCFEIARMIWDDHRTHQYNDPIINYVVTMLSETKQFSENDSQSDPFVEKLVKTLPQDNWCIVDGNVHPEALKALCECKYNKDNCEPQKTQRLNIILAGSPKDAPGLRDVLTAVQHCDIRINITGDRSFLRGDGELPLDDAVLGLHGNGKASLASITGYLKEIKKLDAHPATRRTYKVSLRICTNNEYTQLRDLCKNSRKLSRVMLRISYKAEIDPKKLKELPVNISNLTVFLEGFGDEDADKAIKIWRAIQGKIKRQIMNLCFWDIYENEKRLSPESIKKIIKDDLPGTKIEVPLEQPVSSFDKDQLQAELNMLQEDKYMIKFLGSPEHPRFDMKKEKKGH